MITGLFLFETSVIRQESIEMNSFTQSQPLYYSIDKDFVGKDTKLIFTTLMLK
jgi:hypothetical protein